MRKRTATVVVAPSPKRQKNIFGSQVVSSSAPLVPRTPIYPAALQIPSPRKTSDLITIHDSVLKKLETALREYSLIILHGPAGTGKATAAKVIAETLGYRVVTWQETLPEDGSLEDNFLSFLREIPIGDTSAKTVKLVHRFPVTLLKNPSSLKVLFHEFSTIAKAQRRTAPIVVTHCEGSPDVVADLQLFRKLYTETSLQRIHVPAVARTHAKRFAKHVLTANGFDPKKAEAIIVRFEDYQQVDPLQSIPACIRLLSDLIHGKRRMTNCENPRKKNRLHDVASLLCGKRKKFRPFGIPTRFPNEGIINLLAQTIDPEFSAQSWDFKRRLTIRSYCRSPFTRPIPPDYVDSKFIHSVPLSEEEYCEEDLLPVEYHLPKTHRPPPRLDPAQLADMLMGEAYAFESLVHGNVWDTFNDIEDMAELLDTFSFTDAQSTTGDRLELLIRATLDSNVYNTGTKRFIKVSKNQSKAVTDGIEHYYGGWVAEERKRILSHEKTDVIIRVMESGILSAPSMVAAESMHLVGLFEIWQLNFYPFVATFSADFREGCRSLAERLSSFVLPPPPPREIVEDDQVITLSSSSEE